ncbi:MAG TPA: amidase family protein [Candidatus Paceibacterota bacterium]|nr:hypothetical protein [Verrucomicrobiota bacterium]HOX02096.1 amidase family protein [Verrucomicrobiota bacterium]HRZ44962.1 amidase family protein [Candidatus Paceibacterota bacterium]HRZ91614.1 amidase family protein [Candidatus Paceibacterota bacterium]
MDSICHYRNSEPAASGDGPLRGLRVALQPNFSVAGWPAEAGSKALAQFTALEDATIVRRLRRAGAVLWGSTRMSEFGFGLRGSQAGGALLERAADVELVLDLMGESRAAASRAGVCGFKPSYGLVSRCGLVDLIPSMECCGLLSRSLAQIREILKVVAGPDEGDFSLPDEKAPDFSSQAIDPSRIRIGVLREAREALSAGAQASLQASVDELARAGFSMVEVSLPEHGLFPVVHRIAGSVEASSCAGRYDSVRYGARAPGGKNWNGMYIRTRGAAFGALLKSYLIQGAFFQFDRYGAFEDACRIRARLVAGMERLAAEADFLLLPAVDGAAPEAPATLAETYAQFAPTLFANVTGQPALFLPARPGAPGAGFQLAGPRRSDPRLIALGEHVLKGRKGGGQ